MIALAIVVVVWVVLGFAFWSAYFRRSADVVSPVVDATGHEVSTLLVHRDDNAIRKSVSARDDVLADGSAAEVALRRIAHTSFYHGGQMVLRVPEAVMSKAKAYEQDNELPALSVLDFLDDLASDGWAIHTASPAADDSAGPSVQELYGGRWRASCPLPFYLRFGRCRCECGRRFRNEETYCIHWRIRHAQGPAESPTNPDATREPISDEEWERIKHLVYDGPVPDETYVFAEALARRIRSLAAVVDVEQKDAT